MAGKNRPIERSIVLGCTLFTLILCALLSAVTSYAFSRWFYDHYNSELKHVLTSLERAIDVEDLQQCMTTGEASEKYDLLQAFVNASVDDFEMAYVYIVVPHENGAISSVCASTSEAERAAGDVEDWDVMHYVEDAYTPETIKPYLNAWKEPGITYFENSSDQWGNCYTACVPLVNKDGETFALLCADYFIDDLRSILGTYTGMIVIFTIAISLLFMAALVIWLRRNVTDPIMELERSARTFAKTSAGHRDPSALLFNAPEIRRNNELKSLADALVSMSEDMRDYVEGIVSAEQRAQDAEEEAEDMMRIAYEDPLTHARSKAAYEIALEQLAEDIDGGSSQFAVIMVDLDKLKTVNDTFGHKEGDAYIEGAYNLMNEIFGHTPIYRIGGDEFVIILQGPDYERRYDLLDTLRGRFAATKADENKEPWERFSASVGMAKFQDGDKNYQAVFMRADGDMYSRKKERR